MSEPENLVDVTYRMLKESMLSDTYELLDDSEKRQTVDGIIDDVLVITDPQITSDEYDELIDRAQEIIEETPEGEIPVNTDYIGDYVHLCPICGASFTLNHIAESGTECPICMEVPESFVLQGQLQYEDVVAEDNDVSDITYLADKQKQDDEETEDIVDEQEETEPELQVASKQLPQGNKLTESYEINDDLVNDLLEFSKGFDPYNFDDEYKDDESFINQTNKDLSYKQGIEDIIIWLNSILEEAEDDDLVEQVNSLIARLEERKLKLTEKCEVVEESLEQNNEDGWGDEIEDTLKPIFDRVDKLKYEVENCTRGSYAKFGSEVKDLVKELKEIAEELDNEAETIDNEAEKLEEVVEVKKGNEKYSYSNYYFEEEDVKFINTLLPEGVEAVLHQGELTGTPTVRIGVKETEYIESGIVNLKKPFYEAVQSYVTKKQPKAELVLNNTGSIIWLTEKSEKDMVEESVEEVKKPRNGYASLIK